MSVGDYIHPAWREAWHKVRAGFSAEDDGPYVDDEAPKQISDGFADRVPGHRLNYTTVEYPEVLVHDGSDILGPTGWGPRKGQKYTDAEGHEWKLTRVETYKFKGMYGYQDKARIWARRES